VGCVRLSVGAEAGTGGWRRGATVDADGRRCLYGAVHVEAGGPGDERQALAVLEEVIRRRWGALADTIPAANDHLVRDHAQAVRLLDDAADLAHARGL